MPCPHKPARVTFVSAGRVKDRADVCLSCDEVAPGELAACPGCGGSGRAEYRAAEWGKCPMCQGQRVVYVLAGAS